MERRHFLKLAFGFAAGAAALAASAQAAPLAPHPLIEDGAPLPANPDAHPAVTSADEVDRLKPEEVRWGRHRRWHRRHWGCGAGVIGAGVAAIGAGIAGTAAAGDGAAALGAAVTGKRHYQTATFSA